MSLVKRLSLMAVFVGVLSSLGWSSCESPESADSGGGAGPRVFERRKQRTAPAPAPAPPPPAPPPPAPPPAPADAGWTVLAPSSDTRTVYVSNSTGDDAANGLSSSAPKRTIAAGLALLRSSYPDWLLLKAGDTWANQKFGNLTKSGRSASEPMVIASYGTGARPFLQTGTSTGLSMDTSAVRHVAVVGVHLKAHTYTGTQGSTGIRLLATCDDILFEDCFIEGYKDNLVLQANNGPGTISDVRLRRSVVVDAYSATTSHSQGIYASYVDGLLIEDCVFDHNGWQGGGGAPATMYNHNTYISRCTNVTVRGNLFLRASSIGNKFRSDAAGESHGLLIENNFYIEGEIGISLGGNAAAAQRFAGVTVRDNVMMHIGRTQPTGRGFSWYLDVQDWDGGTIEGNLFLHQPLFTSSYGLYLGGQTERQIAIRQNVFYGLKGKSVDIDVDGSETGISVTGNEFQDPFRSSQLVRQTGPFSAATYQGNSYFSTASSSAWFRVNGADKSYSQWLTLSGETGSFAGAITYPDPGRDETTYMTSLGRTATLAAFVAEARLQSKASWRTEFTAPALNTYVRAGFGR